MKNSVKAKESNFEKMSASLTGVERHNLLKKINHNMNYSNSKEEDIFSIDISKEEKERMILAELSSLDLFGKFILWVKKTFLRKSNQTIFIELKMAELRKKILKKSPRITNFKTRLISKTFAESVFDLSLKVSQIVGMFDNFWDQEAEFQKIVTELLESRINVVIKNIDDLISDDDAEAILFEKETKAAIREEVIKRFSAYAQKYTGEIFNSIEEEFMPLYYFRPVVVFPYVDFLVIFGFNPQSERFIFRSATGVNSVPFIEKLYYAIYMVLKTTKPIKINYLISKYFYKPEDQTANKNSSAKNSELDTNLHKLKGAAHEGSANGEIDSDSIDSKSDKLNWFYDQLNIIYDTCKKLNKEIPFIELIKYYKNDFYYKLAFYMPKLRLREFYFSNLKTSILGQVDKKYLRAKGNLIQKNIEEFFKNKEFKNLENFNENPVFDYRQMGVEYFKNIRSIRLLFNYLIHYYYNGGMRLIIDTVSKVVFTQDKSIFNSIMANIAALDNVYVKIHEFDKSLNPESGEGKFFEKMCHDIGKDAAYLRMYKDFIQQKNKASKHIITMAVETLDAITKNYSEILDSPKKEIKELLENYFTIGFESKIFKEYLVFSIENINFFENLLIELDKFERGKE